MQKENKMNILSKAIENLKTPLVEGTVHVTPVKGGKYHVVKSTVKGIDVGEKLNDTELDDVSEMGHKIKHVKSKTVAEELETITEEDIEKIQKFFAEDLNLSQLSQQIITLLRMVLGSGALGNIKIKEEYNIDEDSLIDLILASLRENRE